jgi:hypothetical protein
MDYHQLKDQDKNGNKTFLKGFLISGIIIGLILNGIYGFGLANKEVMCMEDLSHVYTNNINKYLHENQLVSSMLTIFSSLCIDIIIIYSCYLWIFYCKSWRLFATLLIFYTLRMFTQFIFQMKYPDGYMWNYPGLPSLTVSYLKTSDFFYSGHTGLPIILACEFLKYKKVNWAYFSLFGCLFEFLIMILMRGHYIIDLVFGIITAHYFYIIVDRYVYLIDESCITLKCDKKDSKKKQKEASDTSTSPQNCNSSEEDSPRKFY